MANKSLKTLNIITGLMKNDRVREFEWLDTRSWEEDRYYCHNIEKPVLPDGCEFPSRRTVCVKKIENKEDYIDLLLDADPSKTSIYKYLNDSDVYGLQVEENIVSLG